MKTSKQKLNCRVHYIMIFRISSKSKQKSLKWPRTETKDETVKISLWFVQQIQGENDKF